MFDRGQGDAMINDIKINSLNMPVSGNQELKQKSAKDTVKDTDRDADDVTLAPHLGNLVVSLNETDIDEARLDRIISLKNLINNNEYELDMESLSRRLSQNSLLTKGT